MYEGTVIDVKDVNLNCFLTGVFYECLGECEECGIEYGNIDILKLNTRLRSSWGRCSLKRATGKYVIELSHKAVVMGEQFLKETLLHEICHTVEGCFNHGRLWKNAVETLNYVYGYNIQHRSNGSELADPYLLNKDEVLYTLKCKKCGEIASIVQKKTTNFNHYRYSCSKCGGNYELVNTQVNDYGC